MKLFTNYEVCFEEYSVELSQKLSQSFKDMTGKSATKKIPHSTYPLSPHKGLFSKNLANIEKTMRLLGKYEKVERKALSRKLSLTGAWQMSLANTNRLEIDRRK